MSEPQETITISINRLQKVIQALSYASVEAIPEAQALLQDEIEDSFGEVEGVLRIFLQELQNAQIMRLKQEQQKKLIEAQQIAIKDLSTPIIDLWEDIITLPIVGVVDSQRALEMTERLLQRVVDRGSRCIIIDITGVNVVDTMTADHFVKMVKAVRYLGSYCVVTGISPEIAQTLVLSGVDMGNVKTLRSLKEGLKDCFHYLKQVQQERR